jgi:hypothetical protein
MSAEFECVVRYRQSEERKSEERFEERRRPSKLREVGRTTITFGF